MNLIILLPLGGSVLLSHKLCITPKVLYPFMRQTLFVLIAIFLCVSVFAINVCGDGVVEAPEACDDGGLVNGDGCGGSSGCDIESGWICNGSPSVCSIFSFITHEDFESGNTNNWNYFNPSGVASFDINTNYTKSGTYSARVFSDYQGAPEITTHNTFTTDKNTFSFWIYIKDPVTYTNANYQTDIVAEYFCDTDTEFADVELYVDVVASDLVLKGFIVGTTEDDFVCSNCLNSWLKIELDNNVDSDNLRIYDVNNNVLAFQQDLSPTRFSGCSDYNITDFNLSVIPTNHESNEDTTIFLDDFYLGDTTPPLTKILGKSTTWTNFDQNIVLVCDDNISGCKSTSYRINNGSWITKNVTNIFTLLDGFEATDYNLYTIWESTDEIGTPSPYEISSAVAKDGNKSLFVASTQGSKLFSPLTKNIGYTDHNYFSYWFSLQNNFDVNSNLGIFARSASNYENCFIDHSNEDDENTFRFYYEGASAPYVSFDKNIFVINSWYKMEMYRNDLNINCFLYDENSDIVLSGTTPKDSVITTYSKLNFDIADLNVFLDDVYYGDLVSDSNVSVSFSVDGNYKLDYNSTDLEGNVETTKTSYIAIDKTKPTITADTNSSYNLLVDANVHLTCSDALSGVKITKFRLDDNNSSDLNWLSWQTYDTNLLVGSYLGKKDGNFGLQFYCTDNASNDSNVGVNYDTNYVLLDLTVEQPSTGTGGGPTDINVLRIIVPSKSPLTIEYLPSKQTYFDFVIKNISSQPIIGLNITMPYKNGLTYFVSQDSAKVLLPNEEKTIRVFFLNNGDVNSNEIVFSTNISNAKSVSVGIVFVRQNGVAGIKNLLLQEINLFGFNVILFLLIEIALGIILLYSFRYVGVEVIQGVIVVAMISIYLVGFVL
jgi:cysteine-rich repeat protein